MLIYRFVARDRRPQLGILLRYLRRQRLIGGATRLILQVDASGKSATNIAHR